MFRTTATPLKENYEPNETINMRIKLDAEKSKYLCPILQSWCFAYITGLNPDSIQGDREIVPLLQRLGAEIVWEGDTLWARGGNLRGVPSSGIPVLPCGQTGWTAGAVTKVVQAEKLHILEYNKSW